MSIRSAFTASRAAADHEHAVRELERRWLDACAYTGLGRMQSTGAGPIIGLRPKPVTIVPTGPTPHLIIELHPGQLMADLEARRDELARALGAWALRFTDRGGDFVRVDLVRSDPLVKHVPFLPAAPADHLVLGVADDGRTVSRPLDAITHLAVAGSTGSGKSGCLYSLIVQLVRMGRHVDVVGLDPSGLLWRPFPAHDRGWRVSGTKDAAQRYTAVLGELVEEMDRRIEAIPERRDSLLITEEHPLRVIVLEELGGIARLTGFRSSGAGSDAQRHLARLAAESRKAAMRLVVCGQRLGSEVLDTSARDQLLTRLTFGCRDLATLRMLSPDATPEDLAPLAQSPAGTCLLDMAGESLTRMRAPWVGDYSQYYDHIRAAVGRPVLRQVAA